MPSAGRSEHPFGRPEAVEANWSEWSHRETARLWEAVAVSLNVEPGPTPTSVRMPEDFGLRLKLAIEAIAVGKLRASETWPAIEAVVLLNDFARWASTKGIAVPAEFPGARSPVPPPPMEPVPPPSLTYWKQILFRNIRAFDKKCGGRANARQVIAALKQLGDKRLPPGGTIDKLVWQTDKGHSKTVGHLTVQNALTEARRWAGSQPTRPGHTT